MPSPEKDAGQCCICGSPATRMVATRGLVAVDQTRYCDNHAAVLLARATRVLAPGETEARDA